MNPKDFIYDVETFNNVFLFVLKNVETNNRWIYELSPRRNDSHELAIMLHRLRDFGARMVGFNNIHFDYPVVHEFLRLWKSGGLVDPHLLHLKGKSIIEADHGDRFAHRIWDSDHFVSQMDLFLIHHFDNRAKTTSLKALEFNMRSHTVEDMPFDPNIPIAYAEMIDVGIQYCCHDVNETHKFYDHTWPMIRLRSELSKKFGIDMTNFNDTKIGKRIFIHELEWRAPGICFDRSSGKKVPRETYRRQINLGEIIFPYIHFKTAEFKRGLDFLRSTIITDTRNPIELKDFHVELRGFRFDIQAGGIHGSRENVIVHADDDHELLDVDVASYYPNLAIKNRLYPAHLSEIFCDVYDEIYQRRKSYDKKSGESAALKLALNGVYGESNSAFPNPFRDPQYTMSITFNGQLLLCMLAEWLLEHPGIELIQINTDGLTARVRRDAREWFDKCFEAWQLYTKLELEKVNYRSMFIRDVNNYIAVGVDGKIKRKGEYQWITSEPNNVALSKVWSQDWSALVIPMAAEAHLVRGERVDHFIYNHGDPFDFMLRAKVKRSDALVAVTPGGENVLPNLTRYYVAKTGPQLFKVMPPLAKQLAVNADAPARRIAVQKGWPVRVCNTVDDWRSDLLDHSYYIEQANKLVRMKPYG